MSSLTFPIVPPCSRSSGWTARRPRIHLRREPPEAFGEPDALEDGLVRRAIARRPARVEPVAVPRARELAQLRDREDLAGPVVDAVHVLLRPEESDVRSREGQVGVPLGGRDEEVSDDVVNRDPAARDLDLDG